jgi:hypothetical protein
MKIGTFTSAITFAEDSSVIESTFTNIINPIGFTALYFTTLRSVLSVEGVIVDGTQGVSAISFVDETSNFTVSNNFVGTTDSFITCDGTDTGNWTVIEVPSGECFEPNAQTCEFTCGAFVDLLTPSIIPTQSPTLAPPSSPPSFFGLPSDVPNTSFSPSPSPRPSFLDFPSDIPISIPSFSPAPSSRPTRTLVGPCPFFDAALPFEDGYTNIADINSDQQIELDRIADGGVPNPPYFFTICP